MDGSASILWFHEARPDPNRIVSFSRRELGVILDVYVRRVADGEWRDYALDLGRDAACFTVYRRASDNPLYKIEKRPALAKRQGAFAIIGCDGRIRRRERDLATLLRWFETPIPARDSARILPFPRAGVS